MSYQIFIASVPGMEAITAREVAELGLAQGRAAQTVRGGVEFTGALADLYRANLLVRTGNRVTVRVGKFHAATFSELRERAGRLAWEFYLHPGQVVNVRATCHKSRLYHSDAVVERVVGAIGDRMGTPVTLAAGNDDEADPPPQLVLVRLFQDRCTISMDTSGALLHRRGYRLATAKAPLRETLAAGMVLASGWDGRAPLLDPFCGSGTIPIEAALWARHIAPGKGRRFALMAWPHFAPDVWAEVLDAALAAERPAAPPMQASDRDAGAIQAAEANAARAGVTADIVWAHQAVSAISPPSEPGWVITNPPYGVRVNTGRDLRNLYAQFGNVLRAQCPGWHVTFLCNDLRLIGQTHLPIETSHVWPHGGLRVRVVQGEVG